jgi:hypothetical protein
MHICYDEVRAVALVVSSAAILPFCVRWCCYKVAGLWRRP